MARCTEFRPAWFRQRPDHRASIHLYDHHWYARVVHSTALATLVFTIRFLCRFRFSIAITLTLVITLLVLVVLSIVSFYTILNVTHELIRETYDKGDLITKQIYEEVRQAFSTAENKVPPSPSDEERQSFCIGG